MLVYKNFASDSNSLHFHLFIKLQPYLRLSCMETVTSGILGDTVAIILRFLS